MSKVISLVQKEEDNGIEEVFKEARDKVKDVVILGYTDDGSVYINNSDMRYTEIITLMEVSKHILIERMFDGE